MNNLFLERLVEIESEETIDSLKHGDVVKVKDGPSKVFDRIEEDMLVFYCPTVLKKDAVLEIKTPREYLSQSGNRVVFTLGTEDERIEWKPKDGEYYQKRRDDLVALGLMK
ncbi:hypothetical protein KY332_00880 [Candidatus Woesearchaeota archaeon]|nr:hypothetical protein [Candidatus Woesearchaeota archaeon]